MTTRRLLLLVTVAAGLAWATGAGAANDSMDGLYRPRPMTPEVQRFYEYIQAKRARGEPLNAAERTMIRSFQGVRIWPEAPQLTETQRRFIEYVRGLDRPPNFAETLIIGEMTVQGAWPATEGRPPEGATQRFVEYYESIPPERRGDSANLVARWTRHWIAAQGIQVDPAQAPPPPPPAPEADARPSGDEAAKAQYDKDRAAFEGFAARDRLAAAIRTSRDTDPTVPDAAAAARARLLAAIRDSRTADPAEGVAGVEAEVGAAGTGETRRPPRRPAGEAVAPPPEAASPGEARPRAADAGGAPDAGSSDASGGPDAGSGLRIWPSLDKTAWTGRVRVPGWGPGGGALEKAVSFQIALGGRLTGTIELPLYLDEAQRPVVRTLALEGTYDKGSGVLAAELTGAAAYESRTRIDIPAVGKEPASVEILVTSVVVKLTARLSGQPGSDDATASGRIRGTTAVSATTSGPGGSHTETQTSPLEGTWKARRP